MNLSRMNQVKKFCSECAGNDNGNRSVHLCTTYACHLFPFRSGTAKKSDVERHLQARAEMDERNRLMRKSSKGKAV